MEFSQVNLRHADARSYAAISTFSNTLKAERFPDEPPFPLESFIRWCTNVPDFIERSTWLAWNEAGDGLLALGHAEVSQREENQHVATLELGVLPGCRRRGLGSRLLGLLAEAAQRAGRRLLIVASHSQVPSGERFLERVGASVGLAMHTNQLRLDELDRALLRRWQTEASQRAPGFGLGLWEGPYPEEQLEAIAELFQLVNQAPRDNLELEDTKVRPEYIRQFERSMFAAGNQRWTIYARERSSGRLAGYSEVFWHPGQPTILYQGMTGVWPEYRGRGLGRWLKAAMLEKVLQERPQVQVVRTGNAHSNAPMLKINFELGFRPFCTMRLWQLETAQALAYAQPRSQAGALASAP